VASAALDAPTTLRNSRRLTPVFSLISVVAVGAVVARLFALAALCVGGSYGAGRGGGGRCLLLCRVARRLEAFLCAIAVHVTAHAPTHVEAGELIDAIHVLDLAVAGLTGDAGIHVAHVREVHVLRHLVNSHPRNGLRLRSHAGAHAGDVRELVELLQLGARTRRSEIGRGTLRPNEVVAPDARRHRGQTRV